MVLIIENGTGLATANSYTDLVGANDYATENGYSDWLAANDADKETALIKATRFINANYSFNGLLFKLTQALAWPRSGAFDKEGRNLIGVPKSVVWACVELARVALTGELIVSPETAAIKRKRVKAGSVETETEFAVTGGSSLDASICPIADKLLSALYAQSSSGIGGGFVKALVG